MARQISTIQNKTANPATAPAQSTSRVSGSNRTSLQFDPYAAPRLPARRQHHRRTLIDRPRNRPMNAVSVGSERVRTHPHHRASPPWWLVNDEPSFQIGVGGRDLSANGALGDGIDDATIRMKPQPEPSSREVLAGLVERVTYHNDGNGYCVLRIKARGHRELVTVVGHAAVISAGEWITASGEWVNDRTYGQQYRAKFLKTSERHHSTASRNTSAPG